MYKDHIEAKLYPAGGVRSTTDTDTGTDTGHDQDSTACKHACPATGNSLLERLPREVLQHIADFVKKALPGPGNFNIVLNFRCGAFSNGDDEDNEKRGHYTYDTNSIPNSFEGIPMVQGLLVSKQVMESQLVCDQDVVCGCEPIYSNSWESGWYFPDDSYFDMWGNDVTDGDDWHHNLYLHVAADPNHKQMIVVSDREKSLLDTPCRHYGNLVSYHQLSLSNQLTVKEDFYLLPWYLDCIWNHTHFLSSWCGLTIVSTDVKEQHHDVRNYVQCLWGSTPMHGTYSDQLTYDEHAEIIERAGWMAGVV